MITVYLENSVVSQAPLEVVYEIHFLIFLSLCA